MAHEAVQITVLVDYDAKEGLETEHGFAVWVKVGDRSILFDTGQTEITMGNVKKLGLDLKDAEALVLSHGHFDHTGNVPEFLAQNETAKIYHVEGVHVDRFSCKPGTPVRTINIQEVSSQAILALPEERVVAHAENLYLMPGVGLTGKVPRHTTFEDVGGPFYLDPDSVEDDLIEDDQSMWFEMEDGLVILLGCCHAGVVNTIDYIRKLTGIEKVKGVIGGMHLVNADQNRLDETIKAMKSWEPTFMVPCHCTGEKAGQRMLAEMGEDIVQIGHAGMTVDIGRLRV